MQGKRKHRLGPSIGVVIGTALLALQPPALRAAAQLNVSQERIVVSGDPAPDLASPAHLHSLHAIVENDVGLLALVGDLTGDAISADNDEAVFMGGRGPLRLLAAEGDAAQNSALTLGPIGVPILNNRNEVLIATSQNGSEDTYWGYWLTQGRALYSLATWDLPLPESPDDAFRGFISGLLSDGGPGLIWATVGGPGVEEGNNHGFWTTAGTVLAPGLRSGSPAPLDDELFRVLLSPVIAPDGRVAFLAGVGGASAPASRFASLWAGSMDAPNLLVRAGDPAPGTGADVVFGGPAIPLGWPGINAGHAIVFRGYLRGPDVTVQNDSGVWLYDGERRELLVRSGQSASGTEMGAVFDGGENAFSDPVIAREGHVAFLARLRGPSVDSTNAEGIWAGKPGAIRLVLRQGAEVATAPGRYWKVKSLGLPSLNRLGDVAFSAVLFDPEAPQQSVPSLWVWVNGCLAPIVWGGASIDLDLPPVSGIGFVGEGSGSTGGDDGRPKGLNARREVVYIATFEGGSSGAYRSRITVGEAPVSLAAVPTPAGPELRFTVPLGCLYRLESAGDLGAQDGWEPVGETRMGDGGLTTLHPPNGESHRYYRLAFP